MEPTKTCRRCGETKSITQFHRNPRTKDGFYGACKSCCAIYQQDYRRKNEDSIKQDKRNYVQNNRDAVLAKKRAYAAANSERESARAIQWQKDNKDKVIIRNKLRRFRERANGGYVTESQWVLLCDLFDNKCACCGKKGKLEVDHVVPVVLGGDGSIQNLQPLCRSCNASKHDTVADYRPEHIMQLIEKGGVI